ncbi:M4 family metallopeptidase [Nocardioides sp. cx-169]|uniref:M4 family metallopeptidase n=1 Tax=Nocardioides sp. cx-169 TaxID=2899080 RepID=UPI0027E1355F|nr:M4 family metallopeptidase [Nocardioides sp. cx-169]
MHPPNGCAQRPGRNGIFGDGRGAPSPVHYGKGYVNAFWDGTKMTYGDGDGVEFGPLVSLDVAGHEMSHGVTETTAGLTYSGESGGLNEATSDIFGSMVEFYAVNAADPAGYLIGEEFDLAGHQGLRRLDDPIADGSSPNCWSANTKNLDVHYSSGVGNHFFYLLAEGSGAKTIGGVATAPRPATARRSPASVATRPRGSGSGRWTST